MNIYTFREELLEMEDLLKNEGGLRKILVNDFQVRQ